MAINVVMPDTVAARAPPLTLPLLVLESFHDDPEWPFDVANTDAGTVAVFSVFVNVDVENVRVVDGLDSENAADVRNTRAHPGALSKKVGESIYIVYDNKKPAKLN
jgi:hypothetical protein